jgi:hypothetical protein
MQLIDVLDRAAMRLIGVLEEGAKDPLTDKPYDLRTLQQAFDMGVKWLDKREKVMRGEQDDEYKDPSGVAAMREVTDEAVDRYFARHPDKLAAAAKAHGFTRGPGRPRKFPRPASEDGGLRRLLNNPEGEA